MPTTDHLCDPVEAIEVGCVTGLSVVAVESLCELIIYTAPYTFEVTYRQSSQHTIPGDFRWCAVNLS
jgi:hypothetical protein